MCTGYSSRSWTKSLSRGAWRAHPNSKSLLEIGIGITILILTGKFICLTAQLPFAFAKQLKSQMGVGIEDLCPALKRDGHAPSPCFIISGSIKLLVLNVCNIK